MLILKLSALTCVFYLGASFLLELILLVLARSFGSFSVGGKPIGWTVWFGVVWLACFSAAWHVLVTARKAPF
jgi:hypothetical protein